MKSYIQYSILVFVLALSTVSCGDYLEKFPLNNPTDVTFLSTQTELELALTGCYTPLWCNLGELPFHLAFDQISDIGWDRNGADLQYLGQGSGDSRNVVVETLWTSMYRGIAKCNYVVANMERGIDNIPEDVYKQNKAEARFLRALYFHYLVEIYGDVPLIEEPITLSEANMARTPKSEVVDFILTELDECAVDLPQKNNPTYGHATKGAAWAIMSRVALLNERWDVAITAAENVMDLGGTGYSLNDSYMDLFQYAGEDSKEIIFSVQFLRGVKTQGIYRYFGSRNAQGYTNKIPSYHVADSWECTDGLQIDESPLYDPAHPWDNRDPRLGYTIVLPNSKFLGFQFETHGDSLECWNYNKSPAVRIPNLDATHAYASFSGITWRKYADILDKNYGDENELNTIIIRYAEVLLNYAEAKIEKGELDQSVVDAINEIRQRPSVDMPPISLMGENEMRFAVRRERKYELSCEGLRLFDIRRWGIAEEFMNMPVLGRMKKTYPSQIPVVDEWGTSHYDNIPIAQLGEDADFKMRVVEVRTFDAARDYLWPIPYLEMETIPKMEQNPGYGD